MQIPTIAEIKKELDAMSQNDLRRLFTPAPRMYCLHPLDYLLVLPQQSGQMVFKIVKNRSDR